MRFPSWRKGVMALAGMASGFGCAAAFTLQRKVHAELVPHPPNLPRSHTGPFDSLDRDSILRGYEVYKQVCSACHSFRDLDYRKLVDICYTEDEAKAEAEEIQVEDEDNETGEKMTRPIKLSDNIALSYIALARDWCGKEDYIFHLLTGHCSPPAGVMLDGEAIDMAPPLYDEAVLDTEGNPATMSQLSKDVCDFLVLTAKVSKNKLDELDLRKKELAKESRDWRIIMLAHLLTIITLLMHKALLWSFIKKMRAAYTPKGRQ